MARIVSLQNQQLDPRVSNYQDLESPNQMGTVLSQAGKQVGAFAEEQTKIYNANSMVQAQLELQDYLSQQEQRSIDDTDIYNFTKNEGARTAEKLAEIKGKYKFIGQQGQLQFNNLLGEVQLKSKVGAESIQRRATKNLALDNYTQLEDKLRADISRNPSAYDAAMKSRESALQTLNVAFDDSELLELNRKSKRDLTATAFESLVNTDVNKAKKFLAREDVGLNIDINKANEMIQVEEKRQLEEIAMREAIAKIQSIGNGESTGYIDPKDTNTKKVLDRMYSVLQTPQDKTNFAITYNTMPPLMAGELRGKIRGTNEQKAEAAEVIFNLQQYAPLALEDVPEKDIQYATSIANKVRAGVPVNDAIESTDKDFDPTNQAVRQERASALTKKKSKVYEAMARDALDSGFWSRSPSLPEDTNISASIAADMRVLYEDAYKNTGDEDTAKQVAQGMFKKKYTTSEVNGRKEIMRFAPEMFYSINGLENDWMREQVVQDVRTIPKYANTDRDNISLMSDSQTEAEVTSGRKPSYAVSIKNEDGTYDYLMDDNLRIKRIVFDPQQKIKEVEAQQAAEKEKKVKAAKGKFEQRKVQQELLGQGVLVPRNLLPQGFNE